MLLRVLTTTFYALWRRFHTLSRKVIPFNHLITARKRHRNIVTFDHVKQPRFLCFIMYVRTYSGATNIRCYDNICDNMREQSFDILDEKCEQIYV